MKMDLLEGLRFINEHTVMWMVYIAACVGMLIVFWRITRSWPGWLKLPLRFLAAIFLLAPALVEPQQEFMAPAFVVLGFEWFLNGMPAAQPALLSYAKALLAGLVLLLVFGGISRAFKKRRGNDDMADIAGDEDAQTVAYAASDVDSGVEIDEGNYGGSYGNHESTDR